MAWEQKACSRGACGASRPTAALNQPRSLSTRVTSEIGTPYSPAATRTNTSTLGSGGVSRMS